MKKEVIRFHQGDVQGFTVNKIPAGAKKIAHRPIAYGEHSGHQHCLTGDCELFEHEGKIYASVGSDGAVLQHVHESNFSVKDWTKTTPLKVADHNPVKLEEGVYEFFIQNAYNPYSKLMEKVLD